MFYLLDYISKNNVMSVHDDSYAPIAHKAKLITFSLLPLLNYFKKNNVERIILWKDFHNPIHEIFTYEEFESRYANQFKIVDLLKQEFPQLIC